MASWDPERIDVFSHASDGQLTVLTYDAAWYPWQMDTGFYRAGELSAVSREVGSIDLFASGIADVEPGNATPGLLTHIVWPRRPTLSK